MASLWLPWGDSKEPLDVSKDTSYELLQVIASSQQRIERELRAMFELIRGGRTSAFDALEIVLANDNLLDVDAAGDSASQVDDSGERHASKVSKGSDKESKDSDSQASSPAVQRTETVQRRSSLCSMSDPIGSFKKVDGLRDPAAFGIVTRAQYADIHAKAIPALVSHTEHRRSLMKNLCVDMFSDVGSVEAPVEKRRWMLEPTSIIRVFVDLISIVVLMYELSITPYVVAWEPPFTGMIEVSTYITLTFWITDMVLNFRSGYFTHGNGSIEMRPSFVAKRYFKTFFFPDLFLILIDVLTVVLNAMSDAMSSGSSTDAVRMTRFVKSTRVLRILKVLRISNLNEKIQRLADAHPMLHASNIILDITRLFLTILWINHVCGCMWFWLGRNGYSDTGATWVELPIESNREMTYLDSPVYYQYTTAVHWALTQMTPGSMQVVPTNGLERTYNILILLSGMFVFSTIVSSISAKMTQHKMRMQEQVTMMSRLHRFLRSKKVTANLAVRLEKQVQTRLKENKQLALKDINAVSYLSSSMRVDLLVELSSPTLQQHPLFLLVMEIVPTFVKKLSRSSSFEFQVLSPGMSLFTSSTPATSAYCPVQGTLRYTLERHSTEDTAVDVSQNQWLSEAALWCDWRHAGVAEATSTCELLVLHASSLFACVQKYPTLFELFAEYAEKFTAGLAKYTATRKRPDDLQCPMTTFEQLLVTMNEPTQVFIGLTALRIMRNHQWNWMGLMNVSAPLSPLEVEVLDRKCILTITEDKDIVRVVELVTIELEDRNGRTLVEMGKWNYGDSVSSTKMPGTKVRLGETNEQAIKRMMDTDFRILAEFFDLGEPDESVEYKWSDRFAITTKYIKYRYKAYLSSPFPDLNIAEFEGDVPADQQRMFIAIPTGSATGKYVLYSWLTQDEYAYFQSNTGDKELAEVLKKLRVNAPTESVV
eukprot:TRINITY_DN7441_c0_g1_i1.p1 TRINITY_DN7441_c0_g1~~TRINITY_DN7441_c0_g1_i1.p1  ORF type:complete len:936 (-),score=162.76 TRINITY_DN7441_c0_g1_i1:184-2991(-)